MLAANLIGTERMVRDRLEVYRNAGVNTLRLSTRGESWHERIESLAQTVDFMRRNNFLDD